MLVLAAIPFTVILVKKNDLGTLECWVNSENDIQSQTELEYSDEVNVADLWWIWFTASTYLYGFQVGCALVLLISGWTCFEAAYESCFGFWFCWIILPSLLLLTNIGFNIWATIIRFDSGGRRCSSMILRSEGWFMKAWVAVTWTVQGLLLIAIILLWRYFKK